MLLVSQLVSGRAEVGIQSQLTASSANEEDVLICQTREAAFLVKGGVSKGVRHIQVEHGQLGLGAGRRHMARKPGRPGPGAWCPCHRGTA